MWLRMLYRSGDPVNSASLQGPGLIVPTLDFFYCRPQTDPCLCLLLYYYILGSACPHISRHPQKELLIGCIVTVHYRLSLKKGHFLNFCETSGALFKSSPVPTYLSKHNHLLFPTKGDCKYGSHCHVLVIWKYITAMKFSIWSFF